MYEDKYYPAASKEGSLLGLIIDKAELTWCVGHVVSLPFVNTGGTGRAAGALPPSRSSVAGC